MAHQRSTIKGSVKSILTGLATTKRNVFINRFHLLNDDSLPALIITTGEELGESLQKETDVYRRELGITVTVKAYENADEIEDKIESIASEVEAAMVADKTIGATVFDSQYTGTSEPVFSSDGAKTVGQIELMYLAVYFD